MRKLLTIGEFAKLMNVSTHQIRYFEEKGVLSPSFIDENGYRMYGLNEVYKLSHIMILRSLDISVARIKESIESYEKDQYIELLNKSIDSIDKKIESLMELREVTKDIVDKAKDIKLDMNKFDIRYFEKRALMEIYRSNHSRGIAPKAFYQALSKSNFSSNLYDIDLVNLYDEDNLHICINVDEEIESTDILLAGEYLCFNFLAATDEAFEKTAASFLKYAEDKGFKLIGKLIVIENSMTSIFYNNELYYEIQMLIE